MKRSVHFASHVKLKREVRPEASGSTTRGGSVHYKSVSTVSPPSTPCRSHVSIERSGDRGTEEVKMTRDLTVPFYVPLYRRNQTVSPGEWKDWRVWRAPHGQARRDEHQKDFWKNWTPYIERKDEEREYQLIVHFSPLYAEKTNVTCTDGVLTIKGNATTSDGPEEIERSFSRRFVLPQECDPFRLSATLENDLVLTITCPKKSFPVKEHFVQPFRTRRQVTWDDHYGKAVAA